MSKLKGSCRNCNWLDATSPDIRVFGGRPPTALYSFECCAIPGRSTTIESIDYKCSHHKTSMESKRKKDAILIVEAKTDAEREVKAFLAEYNYDNVTLYDLECWGGAGPDCMALRREAA